MQAARQLVTESEFLALPVSMTKTELIDGEVYVAPAPTVFHQEVLSRLVHRLRTWADAHTENVFIGQSPVDIRFRQGRILQPDAFVILDRVDLNTVGPLDRIPEICIEVLSQDRRYDRVTKRFIYAAAGVREYWVVEQSGLVERWTGPGLEAAEEIIDTLTCSLLPGFSLDLAALFSR